MYDRVGAAPSASLIYSLSHNVDAKPGTAVNSGFAPYSTARNSLLIRDYIGVDLTLLRICTKDPQSVTVALFISFFNIPFFCSISPGSFLVQEDQRQITSHGSRNLAFTPLIPEK